MVTQTITFLLFINQLEACSQSGLGGYRSGLFPIGIKTKATRGALPGLLPFIHQLHQSGKTPQGARRYFVIQNPGSGPQNGTAPKAADAILTTTDCETEAAVGEEVPGCEIHSSPPPLLTKSQIFFNRRHFIDS